jgi:6-pyruvoyltetrahydropterin/6-carboxytetrahydropterin synthase
MPFEIRINRTFCASHQVRMYDGSLEPLHGHNWNVTVAVGADKVDGAGFVVDFHLLERRLDAILGGWNNRHLNDIEAFSRLNVSAEHVAYAVAQALEVPGEARLLSVEVTEAPGCVAVYRPG